jgi:hypothetical protein
MTASVAAVPSALREGARRLVHGLHGGVALEQHEQRTVDARPERRLQHVLRLGLRGVGGRRLHEGRLHARDGDRQNTQRHNGKEQRKTTPLRHGRRPAAVESAILVLDDALTLTARQHPAAEETQHSGHERERDQHRHQNGDRGRDTHLRQERDADDDQAHQRDEHRHPRGQHGRTRGADGGRERGTDVRALAQFVTVPVDDEQRVVDADGETEHRGQDRGRGLQVEEAGRERHAERADADAHGGGQQVHAGHDQRAVGEREDHQGDEDADALEDAADLRRRLDRLTGHLGSEARGPGVVERGHDRGTLVRGDPAGGHTE